MFTIYNIGKTDSTNDLAKKYAVNSVVVADIQTRGRGRFGRKWASDFGGLWFSIVLEPKRKLFEYTFIASLAVLKSLDVEKAYIKWPNDILIDKQKICGILSEAISKGNEMEKVIVGIGINVNNEIDDELKDIAISLKELKEQEIDKTELLGKILANYEELLRQDSDKILKMYKSNCHTIGSKVKVISIEKTLNGKAVDVNTDGNLIVIVNKEKMTITEGDVLI